MTATVAAISSVVNAEKNQMVLGLFDSIREAVQAVEDVLAVGVHREDISLLARQDACLEAAPDQSFRAMSSDSAPTAHVSTRVDTQEKDSTAPIPPTQEVREGSGAGVLWARLDGLGLLLDFLPLPGVGWIMTAGPLSAVLRSPDAGLGQSAALMGAAFGPTAAGLIGTLVHLGLPEEDAALYIERIRLGSTLVMVPTETEGIVTDVQAVLHYNNAVGIRSRGPAPVR